MAGRTLPPVDPPPDDLDGRLDAWSRERLITPQQADAIRAHEASRLAAPDSQIAKKGRTTPLTEALAYLGVALAVAAVAVIVGRSWSDFPTETRVAIPGVIVIGLFLLGWRTRNASDPALGRLSRVAWLFSTIALVWCAAELTVDSEGRWPLLWTGAAASVYAAALYLVRPAALQHVALLLALALLVGGLLFDAPVAIWSVIWALGVLWIVLGWREVLVGRGTAYTIGTIVALVSAAGAAVTADARVTWLTIVNGAVLIGAGVALRHTPMLVLAAIGLFVGIVMTTDEYLGGGTATAVGLLVAGIVVLAVAVVASRLRRTAAS